MVRVSVQVTLQIVSQIFRYVNTPIRAYTFKRTPMCNESTGRLKPIRTSSVQPFSPGRLNAEVHATFYTGQYRQIT